MNGRNMEQLIEKYKREMLNYSARSSIPHEYQPTPEPEPPQASEPPGQEPPLPTNEVMPAEPTEVEEANYEAEVSEMPELPDEPALSVVARTENKMTSAEFTMSETNYEELRESCRKISSGEENGTEERKTNCTELYNFLAQNTTTGRLSVETYASDRVFGVSSARVMVFIPLPSGNVTIFDGLTDINGNTPEITLPAPPKELSLSPERAANGSTYAGYTVLVEHPEYVRSVFFNVPVFDSIESIQPVQMIAKADSSEPGPIVVNETEPENL